MNRNDAMILVFATSAGSHHDRQIANLFDTLKNAVDRFRLTNLEPMVRACEALECDQAPLDVAVLGQFKSGKSSLLNALIGSDLLPVGVTPVTAVVTRLVAGPSVSVRITNLDGRMESVPAERISEFVTESGNPDNRRRISIVDIETPALLQWPGLRLVDTPGLGSTFGHNTQATKDWLPNVAAALVVVSSDRPLSDEDRRLIDEVQQLAPRVWLILSKVDLLSDIQQIEVIDFLRSQLREFAKGDLPIIPFSIRQDRDGSVRRVQHEIFRPLVEDPARERRAVFKRKVQTLAEAGVAFLHVALQAAVQQSADRERLRAAIFDETVQESVLRDELALAARYMRERIRPTFERQFEPFKEPLRSRLVAALRTEMRSWKGHLEKQTRRYEVWLRDHLTAELVTVAAVGTSSAREIIVEAETRFRRVIEAFRDRLGRNVTRELNVSLAPLSWEVRVPNPVAPDPSFSRTFDTNWDLLWWAIPMPVFGALFHRHFLNMIPWEVEKNVTRLVSDWHDVVALGVNELQQQAFIWSQAELVTLGQLLDRQSDEVPLIKEMLCNLEQGLSSIRNSVGC